MNITDCTEIHKLQTLVTIITRINKAKIYIVGAKLNNVYYIHSKKFFLVKYVLPLLAYNILLI